MNARTATIVALAGGRAVKIQAPWLGARPVPARCTREVDLTVTSTSTPIGKPVVVVETDGQRSNWVVIGRLDG